MVSKSESDAISRYVTAWVNTFPDKPVSIINYEFLNVGSGAETGMAISTIQERISHGGISSVAIVLSISSK